MISVSIDVTLLSKSRFKEVTRKNGKVAKFANLVLIETPGGQYGDYMVKEQTTPEERHTKLDLPILGNGKNLKKGERQENKSPEDDCAVDGPIPF